MGDPTSKVYNPEFLKHRGLLSAKAKNTPEGKAQQKKIMQNRWKNPHDGLNSPERNKKLSITHQKLRDDPNSVYNSIEFKEKRNSMVRNPKNRMKNSNNKKKLWGNPNSKYNTGASTTKEFRMKMSKIVTEIWRKRKGGTDVVCFNR